MGLSKSSDPIRQRLVKSTPEEIIRQRWIHRMIGSLGYPRGLFSVEKTFSSHNRRFDILCHTPSSEGLKPLVLIECKAASIDKEKARSQILGYNERIGAPFLCLILGEEVETFWFQEKKMHTVAFLPTYSQLIQCL